MQRLALRPINLRASNLAAIDVDARSPVARLAVASHIVLTGTKGGLPLLSRPRYCVSMATGPVLAARVLMTVIGRIASDE